MISLYKRIFLFSLTKKSVFPTSFTNDTNIQEFDKENFTNYSDVVIRQWLGCRKMLPKRK